MFFMTKKCQAETFTVGRYKVGRHFFLVRQFSVVTASFKKNLNTSHLSRSCSKLVSSNICCAVDDLKRSTEIILYHKKMTLFLLTIKCCVLCRVLYVHTGNLQKAKCT